jgi:hypothetical protein
MALDSWKPSREILLSSLVGRLLRRSKQSKAGQHHVVGWPRPATQRSRAGVRGRHHDGSLAAGSPGGCGAGSPGGCGAGSPVAMAPSPRVGNGVGFAGVVIAPGFAGVVMVRWGGDAPGPSAGGVAGFAGVVTVSVRRVMVARVRRPGCFREREPASEGRHRELGPAVDRLRTGRRPARAWSGPSPRPGHGPAHAGSGRWRCEPPDQASGADRAG